MNYFAVRSEEIQTDKLNHGAGGGEVIYRVSN